VDGIQLKQNIKQEIVVQFVDLESSGVTHLFVEGVTLRQ
jgi:hypothetical protein